MARNPITVQTTVAPSDTVDEVAPSGTGTGNGVDVTHSPTAPVILLCINRSGSPTTVTLPANGSKSLGIEIPDEVVVVAAGTVAYFWLPAQYFAEAGKLAADVSAMTSVTFAAIRAGTF